MKIVIRSLVALLFLAICFAFTKKGDFRPPGTVSIVDNFFFDETEINNIDWKEYVFYQKTTFGETAPEYLETLPDTTVWRTEKGLNEPFVNTYYQHHSYDNYPVVGISHQQAVDYCIWRTKVVKIMLKENGFTEPKKLNYRLPTKTEWELIASAGYNKKQKKVIRKYIKKQGKALTANMRYKKEEISSEEISPFSMTAPSRSYLPNKHGVYNIYGNVAEMVAEKGIAKGGSFLHYYNDIVPTNKDISYETASNWLGFRCVCEVEY